MQAYIYGLYDPRNEKHRIRYVGVTTASLTRRLSEHISASRTQTNHRSRWIQSLMKQGVRPGIRLLEETPHVEDRYALEREWIALFIECGDDLVNANEGGEGVMLGMKHTLETRQKMSEQRTGRKLPAWTEDQRRQKSAAMTMDVCRKGLHDLTDPANRNPPHKNGKLGGCKLCAQEHRHEVHLNQYGLIAASIRIWAAENDLKVGTRGPIPPDIRKAHEAARAKEEE